MAPLSDRKLIKHLRPTDLRGIARLATRATLGVTHIVEGVHQSVWSTLGVPGGRQAGQTRGVTGMVYRSVEGIVRLVGTGADKVLTGLEPLLASVDQRKPEDPQREAVLAALNGVIGDRLAAESNPLATRMQLRHAGKPWRADAAPANSAPSGKLVVLVHGLCMNDLQWQAPLAMPEDPAQAPMRGGTPFDHGTELAALGYAPVYLRYNTGLHISENGRGFAEQLEQLCGQWPQPIKELVIVAHSMGGLVTRSAVQHARQQGLAWPSLLRHIVFLGTPHHGAPLEKAGNWIDVLLGSTPYSKPFARLAQLRSAGITDLRYGNVLDADWQGRDRFSPTGDHRQFLPLPAGIGCHTVAATVAGKRSLVADRLVGDGLVPLRSALGEHDLPERRLAFPRNSRCITYRMDHMEMLWSPEVASQIAGWLAPGAPPRGRARA